MANFSLKRTSERTIIRIFPFTSYINLGLGIIKVLASTIFLNKFLLYLEICFNLTNLFQVGQNPHPLLKTNHIPIGTIRCSNQPRSRAVRKTLIRRVREETLGALCKGRPKKTADRHHGLSFLIVMCEVSFSLQVFLKFMYRCLRMILTNVPNVLSANQKI